MARPFKILSDFDGVWTNQGPEAELLLDWMISKIAELAEVPKAQAHEELGVLRRQMAAAPHAHGWAPDGRVSAYVDEDPLIESSALAALIGAANCEISQRYKRSTLEGGFESMAAFSEYAFREATASFRGVHPPCIVPDAAEQLDAIREAGAEIVIISNSGADKIANWFQAAGVDAGEGEGHNLRLRGSAMKWFVGETDDAIEIDGRTVHVDRPRYRAAIEAENPDLIIGDVFSLDLALPHVLRTRGVTSAPQTLVLRRHAHTPAWITQSHAQGAIDHLVESVSELPSLVRTLIQESGQS